MDLFSSFDESAELLIENFDAFYNELKTSRFVFPDKTIVITMFVLLVLLCSFKFHWFSKALQYFRGGYVNLAKTPNLKPETANRINSPKKEADPANSLVLNQTSINQDKEKSIAQQKNLNAAVDVDCKNNDLDKTKLSKNFYKNFMIDDLNLRRELLVTQQKLLSKTKQVQSLEKTLQNTKQQSMLNNSTVLAGRNHSQQYGIPNRTSNITRRASFFSSTFVDNNSIKSDSFEDIISEKEEVVKKIQHSKEQTLKFFEQIQDLSKELKQAELDGFLNQHELFSLRDTYEQLLQSSNDLEYLISNGIEKIEKLKTLFTQNSEDKNEKEDKTSSKKEANHDIKNYSQLICENTDLRNAMADLAIKFKHMQEELGRAEEERESFQFEINTLRSALENQKHFGRSSCRSRGGARIVKPVKPRRSRSCSGGKVEENCIVASPVDDHQAPVITIKD